jgi:hypothetical protein
MAVMSFAFGMTVSLALLPDLKKTKHNDYCHLKKGTP